jgi:hypothetical protein
MMNTMNNNKFTWCQFNHETDNTSEIKIILKYIKKIKKKLDDDSLLIISFTGRNFPESYNETDTKDLFLKGRCFLIYKCQEMEILEKEIKDLYNVVKH